MHAFEFEFAGKGTNWKERVLASDEYEVPKGTTVSAIVINSCRTLILTSQALLFV